MIMSHNNSGRHGPRAETGYRNVRRAGASRSSSSGYTLSNARTFQLAGELVSRVNTPNKVVAQTFDDGATERTPEVLDLLAATDVPATSYPNGVDLDLHPEDFAAIARARHDIGNHT